MKRLPIIELWFDNHCSGHWLSGARWKFVQFEDVLFCLQQSPTKSSIYTKSESSKTAKLTRRSILGSVLPTKLAQRDPRKTWDWPETDLRLTWNWPETDLKLTWDWPGTDLGLTWDRPKTDLRLTWERKMKIESSRQVFTERTNGH